MYSIGPPPRSDVLDGGCASLRVNGIARRVFEDPSTRGSAAGHAALLGVYLSDLLRPYRLGLQPGTPCAGRGHSYGEMAEAVITAAVPPGHAIDLVVVAFAIPDITPGRASATYLSHICPGNPLTFAICDQGAATAFTGLRLIREYTRTGACRSAVLVVVEQADLFYSPPVPAAVPTMHTAVALWCTRDDPPAGTGRGAELAALRQHADVPAEGTGALLAAEVAALSVGCTEVTVVVGSLLAATATAEVADLDRPRVAVAGQPHTGIWWELAGVLSDGRAPAGADRPRRVLLADYDPQLRYLCMSAIDEPRPLAGVAGRHDSDGVRVGC
jgi:4-hydroxymandelate oxidase